MRISLVFFFAGISQLFFGQSEFKNVQLPRPPKAKYEYAQTEPSIAVNPADPKQIIAGSITDDYYYSMDGGMSWTSKSLKSKYGVWGDPIMLFDKAGRAYYFHLSTYKKVFIDRIVCQVAETPDAKFSKGSFPAPNGKKAQDKHNVAYCHRKDEIYMTWTQFDVYGSKNPKDSSVILFSKSADHGLTWSAPKRISKKAGDCVDSDNTVEGAIPTVGPNGELFVMWSAKNGLNFQKSLDGGETWFEQEKNIEKLVGGWDLNVPGIMRCNGFPVLICDTSSGANRGRLYLNWSDQRSGETNTDVWLSYSDNQGETWSQPMKVNQDDSKHHQFFSWMALDQQNGNIYVVYFDRRNYNDLRTDVYLSVSTDGGKTFQDHRISESPFIPDDKTFFGDYNGISVAGGTVRPIWPRMDAKKISLWTAIIDNL